MSVVLIGYRGSGKTTVGRILAARLGVPFVDSDEWIVGRAKKTIREIFAEDGEGVFRDHESSVVREVAALSDHVVALGGGALGRRENVAALAGHHRRIIYLRCEPRELLRRIQNDPATAAGRPALSSLGGGIEEIEKILGEREPLWRKVCSGEVDVTELSADEVAEAIRRMI